MDSEKTADNGKTRKLEKQVAELEKLVETLRQSEKKWHHLYYNLPGGSFAVNSDYIIEDVNDFLCKLTGYTREELVGAECGIICPKGPHKCPIFDLGKERIDNDETAVRKRDGEFVPVIKSALRVPLGDKDVIVENFQDISVHKLLEDERLKASNLESIGILAGGIAHDFNNFLTSILGNISLAKSMVPESSELVEILSEAEKASCSAKGLAEQLLTFAKGGQPVKNVAGLAGLITESAGFVLRGSNVSYSYIFSSDLWPVEIDIGQIKQVVSNVVINAKQAMQAGGEIEIRAANVSLETGNDVSLPEGKYVKVEIDDSGPGIDPELIPKIFDPYYSTKENGSGLGLTTSYSIINKHGGQILLTNRPEGGVRVTIYLPATGKSPEEAGEEVVHVHANGARILVMDDEPGVRSVVTRMLHLLGYRVEQAKDGCDAIEAFRRAEQGKIPFDLVILDLTVRGGIGGEAAIKELLKLDPDLKALVSSGYSDHPIIADYGNYGFSGVISKPYRLEELEMAIDKVLGG